MYVPVYPDGMRRANVYLSDEEQTALDAKAAAEGSTRSDGVRSIVDRERNLDGRADADLGDLLAELAPEIAKRARSLSRRDPDLRRA